MASSVLVANPATTTATDLWPQRKRLFASSLPPSLSSSHMNVLHGNLIQSQIVSFTIPSMNVHFAKQATAIQVFNRGVYQGTFVLALLVAAYTHQSATSFYQHVYHKHPELLFVPSQDLWRGLVVSKHIDPVLITPVYIAVNQKFIVLSDD